jgi:hypothetical protein
LRTRAATRSSAINGWDGTAFHPELRCNDHDVDYSQLDIDIANNAIPNYVFITPDLDNAAPRAWLAIALAAASVTSACRSKNSRT